MTDLLISLLTAAAVPAAGWAVHGIVLHHRLASARRDPLTGLHTRAGWTRRARRHLHHPAAMVLLVDLDDFKTINDTHGHTAGDAVLTATAQRLAAWCHHHGVAGRLGGDEFTAITTEATANLDALHDALNTPIRWNNTILPVGASIGVCHLADQPPHARTLSDALTAADTAMYARKPHRGGRRGNPAIRTETEVPA